MGLMGLFKLGFTGQANPTYMLHLEHNTVSGNKFKMQMFVSTAAGKYYRCQCLGRGSRERRSPPSSSEGDHRPTACCGGPLPAATVTRHHHVMESVTIAEC